jgi:hypothetical protein
MEQALSDSTANNQCGNGPQGGSRRPERFNLIVVVST